MLRFTFFLLHLSFLFLQTAKRPTAANRRALPASGYMDVLPKIRLDLHGEDAFYRTRQLGTGRDKKYGAMKKLPAIPATMIDI